MEGILNLKEPFLQTFNLLGHSIQAFVPLINQFSQLLNCAIFFNDIDLHDLNGFLVRYVLTLKGRLVSPLCLFHLFHGFDHFSICQSRIPHLFFDAFSGLFDFFSHFMSQSGFQLTFLFDKPFLLRIGVL